MHVNGRKLFAGCVAFAMTFMARDVTAAIEAGSVTVMKGVGTAQTAGDDPRLLAQGSPIFESDTLTTGKKSFLIVGFHDGSAVTLRSDSTLKVADYSQTEGQESALMQLGKGGLRMLTGAIGKVRPENVKINTRVASIGIRGTDFIVVDCAAGACEEAGTSRDRAAGEERFAGRLLQQQGQIEAGNRLQTRPLVRGDAVYAGDVIATGTDSYAVVGFLDGTVVTVDRETSLSIVNYRYRGANASDNGFVLRLGEGGLHVIAGDIARTDPRQFRLELENAEVMFDRPGIAFEVAQRSPSTVRALSDEPVRLRSGSRQYETVLGVTYRFESVDGPPVISPSDSVSVPYRPMLLAQADQGAGEELPGGGPTSGEGADVSGPGTSVDLSNVYVSVREGSVGVQNTVTREDLVLVEGQAAGVNPAGSSIIPEPAIIFEDPVLSIDLDRVNVNEVNMEDAVGPGACGA